MLNFALFFCCLKLLGVRMGENVKEMSWQKKEEYVRKILSRKFGVKFEDREVPLRGTDKTYRFDLVSPDGSIVGEVKTYVSPTKGGKRPSAKVAHASEGWNLRWKYWSSRKKSFPRFGGTRA